jgi:CRP/FNR family transcriptional regulator, cyclic AMP receptor protein
MTDVTQLLLEDPELAEHLDGERREAAIQDCVAPVVAFKTGEWSPTQELGDVRYGIGVLLLKGLMVRRVSVGGRFGAELLGEGDLMRPWQPEDQATSLPRAGRWRGLRDGRVAVLDTDFTVRVAHYPEVISALFARAVRRARHMAANMAIAHQPRVDVRLLMLFWELADRWGIVRPDGVHLPIRLTHAMLGELTGARRPTVTKALGELAERGLVRRNGSEWLLRDGPPTELGELGAISLHNA